MPAGKANLGPNFYPKLVKISNELGMKPEDLLAVMISESGLNPSAYEQKFKGSGLIGFMPDTLKGLGYKGTWEDFKETSGEEQLDYVKKVVQSNMKLNGGPFTSAAQYYTSNLWPVALKLPGVRQGNPSTPILESNPETVNVSGKDYSKKYYDVGYKILASSESAAYKANPLFDRDKKGSITYGDMMKQVEINKRNPLYQKALVAMKESSGYSPGQEAPTMVAEKDDKADSLFRRFLKNFRGKEQDFYKELEDKPIAKSKPPASISAPAPDSTKSVIDKYLNLAVSASSNATFISIAGERVKRVKTDVSEAQMAQAIIEAWAQLFGEKPSKEQVAIILAQNALETGHRKFMWNFNVGNITTDGKGVFDYYDDLTTDEQIKPGVWKSMNLKYRAYPSLKDGALDYLKILSKSSRYAKAWQSILHPDPVAFSKALKAGGYYTANEAPYTKTLSSLFDKFNKSKGYELAMSGKVEPAKSTQVAMKTEPSNNVNQIVNEYLQQIAASEKKNKKLYKQFLPHNNILIQVKASSYIDAVEFSRVLCSVLDSELMSTSFVHTNGNNVEIECLIPGPSTDCLNAVQELTESASQAFESATHKIGGIRVKNDFFMNKKSSYEKIDPIFATNQYRKFLLKFV